MLKDSGTQRAEFFTEYLNEKFPGSDTTWVGPPEHPKYVFNLRGAGKRVLVHERVFDLWPGSRAAIEKTVAHHKIDEHIAQLASGSELSIEPGNDEKPDFETRTLQTS